MPEIGNLLVSLQMETASFNAGLKQANAQLAGFGKTFSSTAKDISSSFAAVRAAVSMLGVGAAASTFASWAKGMADAGEAAGNLATALGLSLPQVVSLQGVFALTTGSLGEASAALRVFGGHVADAGAKAGPARESFAAIGISLADLKEKGRDPEAMLKLVADRFVQYEDDTAKAAVMTDLFGRGWEKIAPVLAEGAAGIERLQAQAAALDPSAVAAAEAGKQLDNALDTLNKSVTGLANEGFAILEPALTQSAGNMSALAQSARQAIADFNALTRSVGGLVGILRAIPGMGGGAAAAGLPGFGWVGSIIEGAKAWRDRKVVATADVPAAHVPGTDYGGGGARPRVVMPGGGGGGGRKKGGGGGGGSGDADARRLAREAERAAKDLQRESIEAAEERNRLSDEEFRFKEQALKHDLAMERVTKQESIAAERKLLDEKMVATRGFYAEKLAAATADKDETRKLQSEEKLEYAKFLTEREALAQESALETRNKFKEVFSDIGDSIKSSLGGAFDAIIEGTFKLSDAVGNLLKSIGKKLADKAFDKLFDIAGSALFGGGASGGGIFGSLFKAQNGASFRVGGAGALDSQLVAFRASPGEMVDVSRPGDARRGAGETIRIDLNPSEGWVAGVADQRIVTRSGQIVEVAVRQSQRTVARNFGGLSAEAQARQL